jgi:drug/metabolite transporter (DMT)-like permease
MGDVGKKPYVVAVAIQVIYTGLFVVSKAAFDSGINTYVFIFYRLTAATALLLPLALISSCRRRSTTPTATPEPTMSCRLLFKLFLYALLGYAPLVENRTFVQAICRGQFSLGNFGQI